VQANFRCHGVSDDFQANVETPPPQIVRKVCPDGVEPGFSLTLAKGAWQSGDAVRVDYDLLEEELPEGWTPPS